MCGMQIGGKGKQDCAGEKCFPWTGEEQLFIVLEASGSEGPSYCSAAFCSTKIEHKE